MPIKIKAQVLLITTFAILLTAGIVYVMLLPTLSTLRSLNETTDSYQALANAEAGLEIELLNQMVSTAPSIISGSFDCTTTEDRSNNNNERHQKRKCRYNIGSKAEDKNEIEIEINFNSSTGRLRIDSEGKKNKFNRTLFLETNITIPQPTTP